MTDRLASQAGAKHSGLSYVDKIWNAEALLENGMRYVRAEDYGQAYLALTWAECLFRDAGDNSRANEALVWRIGPAHHLGIALPSPS
jgi:hypothetical protein